MDSGSGAISRAMLLFWLWAGAGCAMQLCVEKMPQGKGAARCGVQLLSSSPEVQWFRGPHKVLPDQSHSLLYGGSVLQIGINSPVAGTVYTGRHSGSGAEATVDIGPTCGFTGVSCQSDSSCQRYQTVKCVLTGLFLSLCLSALAVTFYHCREQSSTDAIYSDLKEVTSEGDQAQPGASGQGVQAEPSGSSEVMVEAEAGPRQSLKEQAEAGPRRSLKEQAEAEPRRSLRVQAKVGPGTTQAERQEAPVYTSLTKQPKEAEYQLLRPEGQGGESAVTYSAASDEVTVQDP
ncbi:uncharacterized protein LOC132207377 isoform X2 [Stegostoma tigrinum]|uniref:uncharacterized protein LOC125450615 isoform X2 n=1 Tax=Stegostoma tigrinum TaxID=3053191 RepID=UPI00286FE0AB|nr:uncharacterized protein LOC125450615 isoform X2 [Stegostoma tigrinum]XP_059498790.1 uncharacterized protein LOC132207377 isoform X2 [Stegostoma tigrinum]